MKINKYKIIISADDNNEQINILTSATSVKNAENIAINFYNCPRRAVNVIKLNK